MERLTLSDNGILFLIGWESLILQMYPDQKGLPTIGIGHLLTQKELTSGIIQIGVEPINWKSGITTKQAYALKRQDLKRFDDAVNDRMRAKLLRQHQFDALCILAFNIGAHAFSERCSVPAHLLRGNEQAAFAAWRRWNKVTIKGVPQVSRGLVKRREAEIAIYRHAAYSGRP